jgi:hypothetical protein
VIPVGFDRHNNFYFHFGDERIYRQADYVKSGKDAPPPSAWELVSAASACMRVLAHLSK